jgi:hypothetical protein
LTDESIASGTGWQCNAYPQRCGLKRELSRARGYAGGVDREKLLPRAAIALYVVYWIAVLFGYVRLDSTDFADGVFELLRGAAVALPAFALGVLVGRPRAVASGLVFLVAAVLPEHTVIDGNGVDVTLVGVYGVSLGQALELIAVTTPWLLLGVLARRYAVGRRELASQRSG